MVINYAKEQIALGQIEARTIYGKLNNADLHTKPLRSSTFTHMAQRILGQPVPDIPLPPAPPQPTETMSSHTIDMEESTQLNRGLTTKRSGTPDSIGAKRRKAHILRYVTTPASGSPTDT